MNPLTEEEIRKFVKDATDVTGDQATVIDRIVGRWLLDREAVADEARDAIYDDARDGWST